MNLLTPVLAPAGCSSVPPFASHHPSPLPGRPPTRGRILHVDDDPIVRMVFSGWLRHHDYDHRHAADPVEADTLLAEAPFDLVLSDIHMPGNCRLEWVERVLHRGNPPAVILITGTPELETACRAANLPVAGYLLKPVEMPALDATVQRILRGQRQRADSLALSRDVLGLLGSRDPEDFAGESALAGKLTLLARCLGTGAPGRTGGGQPDDLSWRAAIADTIAVIERTKHSFRSVELGRLRLRLQQLLGAA